MHLFYAIMCFHIAYISRFLDNLLCNNFQEKMHQMLDGLLQNIGYEENTKEDYFIKCLMQEAAKWACKIRHPLCMLMARVKFLHYIQHPEIDK